MALPPGLVLRERFGVCRMAVRQALDQLERGGWITTLRGRGTFVSARRLDKRQQEFRGFSDEVAACGATAASRMVSLPVRQPDRAGRELLSPALADARRRVRTPAGPRHRVGVVDAARYASAETRPRRLFRPADLAGDVRRGRVSGGVDRATPARLAPGTKKNAIIET